MHKIEFTLKREGENWTKLVNEAFEKVRKEAKVDGFRKGKVTKEIFDKKFGKQEYLVEAANKAVGEEFARIMKENNYKLVAEPQIHITTLNEETLEFTMTLVEQPEVKVKKYKDLKVKKDEVKVTEEPKRIVQKIEKDANFAIIWSKPLKKTKNTPEQP